MRIRSIVVPFFVSLVMVLTGVPSVTEAAQPPGVVAFDETCLGQVHDNKSGVGRIGGADRFDVSAAISADTFAPLGRKKAVFIVSGETFPDALSASAAAGTVRDPVLLVARDGIPTSVAAELTRLQPGSIIIVGGPSSVSPQVESGLAAYAPVVTRYGGVDRYDVSAQLAQRLFNIGADAAFVASGSGFADALAGSAAAGALMGPMLLVSRDAVLPGATDYFSDHPPQQIALLGGKATISDSVAATLGEVARTNRYAGADRFEVAAGISARLYCPETHTVYVASGQTFPDALSGSAAAAMNGGPMLLVTKDTIPEVVATELRRLQPTRIVVLGGPATVGDGVLAQLGTFIAH